MDPSPPRGSPSHPHSSNDDNINDDGEQSQPRVRFAEGEPQASYRIYQPTPRRERPATATTGSTDQQPAVYWDDRENDQENDPNLQAYTFYREGTPTPPEYESHEKALGPGPGLGAPVAESSTLGGGTIGSDGDLNVRARSQGETSHWSLPNSRETSVVGGKRMFRTVIAIGVLVLLCVALGLGVGLGVGLSQQKSAVVESVPGPSSSLSPASAVSLAPNPTPTNPTPAGTEGASETTTESATRPRPTYNSDCPSLNNTVYHVPGSTKTFLRICGVDYSGDEATDLAQVYTGSMADCMNSCASFNQCTACSWGYIQGDEGGEHRCFMKNNLKTGHTAASDWCFAILQETS
ncbi:d01851cc-64ce-4463-ba05-69fda98c4928 [Thermothielavioides terrestris]|uniref:D01851cc-64ce-4463-ba05-69fda98c4928 n=1 Tax=Thermothielavioides terrestris TaxID=2587410 RepID=A0A446B9R4_9PEZI|nr:d01851cc-64ce-4463-ba05-69fda98c4928 [Thermothielavioides terrestris]